MSLIDDSVQLYQTMEAGNYTAAIQTEIDRVDALNLTPTLDGFVEPEVPWHYYSAATRDSSKVPNGQINTRDIWGPLFEYWYASKFWSDDAEAAQTYGARLVWTYPSFGWSDSVAKAQQTAGKPECYGTGTYYRMDLTWAASVPNMVSGHVLEAAVINWFSAFAGDAYWHGQAWNVPSIGACLIDGEKTPGLIDGDVLAALATAEGEDVDDPVWRKSKARWALDIVHKIIRKGLQDLGWGHLDIWTDPTWAWQPSHDLVATWCTPTDTLEPYITYLQAEAAALGETLPPIVGSTHAVQSVGGVYEFLSPARLTADLDTARALGVVGPCYWAARGWGVLEGSEDATAALLAYKAAWEAEVQSSSSSASASSLSTSSVSQSSASSSASTQSSTSVSSSSSSSSSSTLSSSSSSEVSTSASSSSSMSFKEDADRLTGRISSRLALTGPISIAN